MINLLILNILSIIPFPLTYLISYPLSIAYLLPLIYQLLRALKGKPVIIKEKTVEKLSFLCLIFLIIDSSFVSKRLILVAIHLTINLIIIKSFRLLSKKDRNFHCLLLFFLISAGIANSFHLLTFLYLIIVFYFFVLFLLEENGVEKSKARYFSFFSLIFGIFFSIPLFILFPRLKVPYLPGVGQTQESTYYQDFSLGLNDIEKQREKREIVLRIKFEKRIKLEEELYIRVRSFSTYKNGNWFNIKQEFKALRGDQYGKFIFSEEKDFLKGQLFSRGFFRYLPGFYGTVYIKIPLDYINISRDGSIYLPSSYLRRRLSFEFGMRKDLRLFYNKEPSTDELMKSKNERISKLVLDILNGENDKEKAIIKILEYINKNYKYGFESSNLEEFLFEKKTGNCEFFATSFALFLREAGIPSRVVVGYLGGEKHPWQNYYIVRTSNSHAWVEAYVNGNWILIDPTPAEARPRTKIGDVKEIFKYIYETISFFWDKNVIGFSYLEQIEIIQSLRNYMSIIKNYLKYFYLLLIIPIFFALKTFYKNKIPYNLKYYKKLKENAIKKFNLPDGITPERLLKFLKSNYPQISHYIEGFFKLYLSSSFGGKKVSKKEMKFYFKKIKF